MIRDAFGLIYAGEQNINLRELVYLRTVGALPVGGRYRSIDFVLSNMVNTGIHNVGVIAQRSYHSLMDHLGSGKEWDLSRKSDGLFILPPYSSSENMGSYRGIVDAIKGVMGYIRRSKQQYCIFSGSYTIYNRTYDDMLKYHIDTGADITMLYNEEEADSFKGERFKDVRIHQNEEGRVIDLEINSPLTDSKKAGMDTYVIRKELLEYLVEDCVSRGKYNFVSDLLMNNLNRIRIMGFKHEGYVGRLHSVASYYKLNMDFLDVDVQQDLFYANNRIYTKIKDEVPAKYAKTSNVKNSLIANGCIIEGEVEDSILFRSVYVGKGAKIKNCVIMQDSEIYNNSTLEYVILDKSVNIRQGRRLVGDEVFPVVIRKGAIV
ncbi:glucose-1-phosphate adenylyltransferase subunit GlgD [Christensenellaceae bacterium OttesenSCG-928-K19]|nr:glucose-1-phosphate adenylyltransferase subunit GlgD [Christensenellaceae bacterium OttesenSCG-928-K19]